MINMHAMALEGILLSRGLTISKGNHKWTITKGAETRVLYRPDTGSACVCGTLDQDGERVLRGNPVRVAGIIEGLVR